MSSIPSLEPRRPYFQQDFPASEFTARREKLMAAVGPAAALLRGEGATGAFDLFRQNNELYYLCGVEVPVSYLLIDGSRRKSTIYLPPLDLKHEQSEGAQLSADDGDLVREWTGIEHSRPLEKLRADLAEVGVIYLPHAAAEGRQACRDTLKHARKVNSADPLGQPPAELWLIDQIKSLGEHEIRDLTPILDRLRMIKSDAELRLMRQAGRLCALGLMEAVRATRVGMMEFQLAAAAEHLYLKNGARGGGYRPIVASGANIWNIHYYRNNCPLRDGELVLFDYAPDCGNYTSDIGRMWPVNGKYSPVQRELYGFVVEYHQILLDRIRPGITARQVIAEARERAKPMVESWRWSKPIYRHASERLLEFEGSLSHPVGMAVHDVGDYKAGELAPGMVFAVDPQWWAPEERLYVRVEDTVVVTHGGIENLTAAASLELDEMENAMRQDSAV